MAIANANYEFIMVGIGANGRVSDRGVFSNSSFYKNFQEKKSRFQSLIIYQDSIANCHMFLWQMMHFRFPII